MLIVSNWKAYVEDAERAKALYALAKRASKKTKHELVLAPATPHVGLLARQKKSKVKLASQDVSEVFGGAITGEVTAQILEDLEVSYALIGHSERRARGETDVVIAEKARRALAQGISPILCVGRKESRRGRGIFKYDPFANCRHIFCPFA
jgi:triosephosphate isomerase